MLLSKNRWQGADLGKLLEEELEPYRRGDAEIMLAAGPQLLLEPRYAQTIALAVHELATNAAKYGALSIPSGKVTLRWDLGTRGLRIEWMETEGPPAAPPAVNGYGMKVIRSIEQLGGETTFDWRTEGLCCVLSLPHAETHKPSRSHEGAEPHKARTVRSTQLIAGNSVLLVEDEAIVAMMMADALASLGFRVVGPCNTVEEALAAKTQNHIDAAILDVNLRGALVYPLAETLDEEGIPLAFVTGYGAENIDARFSHVPLLQKPINAEDLRNLFVVSGKQTKVEPDGLVRAEFR
jgi:CheY-like chemotaxis protein